MALTFKKHTTVVSNSSKVKSQVGEPDCLISAVTCGYQNLVANCQVVQSADHDFASLTLIPTVVLSHDIPDDINGLTCRS